MNKVAISKCVKMAMIKKGVGSEEMAQALGVAETTIAKFRAGGIGDVEKLSGFAEACGMTFSDMMRLAE